MLAWFENKWFSLASLSVLFFAIFAVAWTGNPIFFALPVGYLFVLLAGVNWKKAYWIFLFTIPPSTQISLAGDTLSLTLPDQPMMWLFLAIFVLVLARNPRAIPQWWWRDSLVLVIVLQFIWTAVAVIFSKMLFFSFKFLLVKTWLLVCFFFIPLWIFREKKDFVRGFLVMLVPMLLTIIVILIHHAILGFRFDEIQHAITDLYYNHVDYSTVISMFFPLLVFTCWPLIRHRNVVMKSVLILVILIFIAGIGFAYARAAVVAVVFALVVGMAMRLRLVNLVMPGFYALIILLMVYMVPNNQYIEFRPDYEHTFMRKNFVDHVIATFRGKDMSSMERLYRWIAAVRMSKENPVTGVGPRAFVYYYKPHAVTAFRTYVSRNPEQSTTHNYFLYMLVEQGWPAMLLYALFMIVVFRRAQKIYHRFKDRFYRCVVMGLTMTIAAGFINNFFSELIETHKVAALFYIPVALLIILDRKSKEEYAAIKRGEVPVVE